MCVMRRLGCLKFNLFIHPLKSGVDITWCHTRLQHILSTQVNLIEKQYIIPKPVLKFVFEIKMSSIKSIHCKNTFAKHISFVHTFEPHSIYLILCKCCAFRVDCIYYNQWKMYLRWWRCMFPPFGNVLRIRNTSDCRICGRTRSIGLDGRKLLSVLRNSSLFWYSK